jgi:chitodextrinase
MPITLKLKPDNCGRAVLKRKRRLTRSLAGALLLAGLEQAMPARSAIPTGTYSVTLSWLASPSAAVAGYRLYSGVTSGLYLHSVDVGNVTTNTVAGLVRGTGYFFAITAYDTNGLESAFSNEITLTPGVTTMQFTRSATGAAVVSLTGLSGQSCEVQASEDLRTWTSIGLITLRANSANQFTDANASYYAHRFYRTVEKP